MTISRITAPPDPVLRAHDLTPTVGEFLDAAQSEYTTHPHPAGLRPFLEHGRQMRHRGDWSGLAARVWRTPQDQVVVAYQGTTGGDNALRHPLVALAQIAADVQIVRTETPPAAARRAADFAEQVVQAAQDQDVDREDVFLTGHSLGGIEAEYAAQKTGLGGISFEATGVPQGGNPNNFVNVVTYGDPVACYSSDVYGAQPVAPPYRPDKTGDLPHHGPVVMVGDPANQAKLMRTAARWGTGRLNDARMVAESTRLILAYHMPVTQAQALGVELTQTTVVGVMNLFADRTGPVVHAANDTIPEFLHRARRSPTMPGDDLGEV